MPFGLKGVTLQHLMDSVLRDLPFLFVYLDDILMAGTSEEEHMAHLRQLFVRLSEHGLIINLAKYWLGQSSITFLGTASLHCSPSRQGGGSHLFPPPPHHTVFAGVSGHGKLL